MNNSQVNKDIEQDIKISDLNKRLTKIEKLLYGTIGQTFVILIILLEEIL